MSALTREEHRDRHKFLHPLLDELAADYIAHHSVSKRLGNSTIMELIQWSAKQMENPCEIEGIHDDDAPTGTN
jgi:hypothetical protein